MQRPEYPLVKPGWERWSSSGLELYLRCGLAWQFRKDAAARKTVVPLMIGSAVHVAAAHDAQQKKTAKRVSPAELVEVAISGYEAEADEADCQESTGAVSRGKDSCADAAREYAARAAPRVVADDLLAVEWPTVIDLEDPISGLQIELAGTADRWEKRGVGDVKTGVRWPQSRVDGCRQLAVYDLLYDAENGYRPPQVYVDNIYRDRGRWSHQRLFSTRTEEDRDAIWEIVVRATLARKAGIALPAPEGAWWCSKSWCPHWEECPAVVGRRS